MKNLSNFTETVMPEDKIDRYINKLKSEKNNSKNNQKQNKSNNNNLSNKNNKNEKNEKNKEVEKNMINSYNSKKNIMVNEGVVGNSEKRKGYDFIDDVMNDIVK